jgi:predicted SAM-dependent methyltransferase
MANAGFASKDTLLKLRHQAGLVDKRLGLRRKIGKVQIALSEPPSLARKIRAAEQKLATSERKLHLGCGRVRLDGWINIDNDPRSAADVHWDLRRGLPIENSSVDFVYSEHLFEHLILEHGLVLLRHCRRVLREGGVIRIAMPSLQAILAKYQNTPGVEALEVPEDPEFEKIDSLCRYLNTAMRAWGHLYIYDFDDLSLRLRQCGFHQIKPYDFGESEHPQLAGLETREASKLIVEAS